jgi:hypothetical protein
MDSYPLSFNRNRKIAMINTATTECTYQASTETCQAYVYAIKEQPKQESKDQGQIASHTVTNVDPMTADPSITCAVRKSTAIALAGAGVSVGAGAGMALACGSIDIAAGGICGVVTLCSLAVGTALGATVQRTREDEGLSDAAFVCWDFSKLANTEENATIQQPMLSEPAMPAHMRQQLVFEARKNHASLIK